MAKSKSFFGLRRGSTKSQTFSVLRGEQITKDRVTDVANPKTSAQMRQRVLFAEAVKFYKHAVQNLFKFAFEDKQQQESDYNAFMRHNVQNSIILPYDNVKNDRFPALGNAWVMSYGSLARPEVSMSENAPSLTLSVFGMTSSDTISTFYSRLIEHYGLQKGDFLTIIGIQSYVDSLSGQPNVGPKWNIKQYVIDPDATEKPSEFDFSAGYLNVNLGLDDDFACGGAVIFSRDIPGVGVKVSTSVLMNNEAAYELVNAAMDEGAIAMALNTWGATGKAILQGALVGE